MYLSIGASAELQSVQILTRRVVSVQPKDETEEWERVSWELTAKGRGMFRGSLATAILTPTT